jgi:hypothetical protein
MSSTDSVIDTGARVDAGQGSVRRSILASLHSIVVLNLHVDQMGCWDANKELARVQTRFRTV